MDGLECSEVLLSDIDLGDRIDAEYFSKEYLNVEHLLDCVKTKRIGQLSYAVASAFYPAATQLYSVGDIAFVRCVDCINYPVISKDQDNRFEKIPRSFAESNKGISILRRNDIVITKVGTPCYASIVDEYNEVALSRTVLGLTSIHDVNPRYLMVFLRCKYGFGQLYRQRELTIQYQLTLPRVKAVDVFIPSVDFQTSIAKIASEYHKTLHDSGLLYQSAQKHLLADLHFNYSAISTKGTAEKFLFESFGTSGRLDAEYYQPKYDDLFALLYKLPTKPLGKIVDMTKSIEPGSEYYGDTGVPFIRVSDVSTMGINIPSIRIPKTTVPSIEKLYPKKDTILFSKDGSVGIAYKIEEDIEAVTSGALLHFRVKNILEVLPDYLTLVLNSEIVQLQAERDTSGAIIQHWKPSDIANVVIPILPYDIQIEISEKVQKSFALRRQAEKLIETAVKAVEIAIESDEAAANAYIEANVK
ncbi:hypothetical protein FMM68_12225 [Lachnospiraceae bacterium MD329]|nr:hypothetical protein [Lachnospiraceae bacterium MD329]